MSRSILVDVGLALGQDTFASTIYGRMVHALYSTHVAITRIAMGYSPGQWDLKKLIPTSFFPVAGESA